MSDTPPNAGADAPAGDGPKPAKPAKGIKGTLSKKVGPLPLGVWILAFGGGLAVALVIRRRALANESAAAAGTATDETGGGWDQPDPGGTNPGVGGNIGGGGGSDWSDDWTAPLPDLPGWIDAPWQDPPEPSVPGTAGGAGAAQVNNGGPTGPVKHRYVPEGPNKPKCKVCGKWRDTAYHTNRDAPKPGAGGGGNGGGGNGGGGSTPAPVHTVVAPANPDEKHRYVPTSPTQPRCKKCGRWRDVWVHTNR